MRRWLHILLFVLPLLSCAREVAMPYEDEGDDAPEGKVKVSFTVSMPSLEASAATKALGETSQLTTLYLAVYGSTGGFKEYVAATLADPPEGKSWPVVKEYDFGGEDGVQKVDTYVFSAYLKLSNTERTIHFLGNGPEPSKFKTGKAQNVLPDLLGEQETGFWQMITIPGIHAKRDPTTQDFLRDANGYYIVDDDTQAYFEGSAETADGPVGIALIRNWAKIVLRADAPDVCHFTPISYAIINYPLKGTLVPYGGKNGFITGYQKLDHDKLSKEELYPGNLPDGIELSGTGEDKIPTKYQFEHPGEAASQAAGVVQYDSELFDKPNEPAVYLYERPVPGENLQPTYLLIYGKYLNTDDPIFSTENNTGLTDDEKANGVMCFYKVDFMVKGEYFPIFRNFRYQIFIQNIASKGYDDPAIAAASAGSADVSSDVNASHLSDISDGTRRMIVQPWLSKTYIHGVDYYDNETNPDKSAELFVAFYDNINAETVTPNTKEECVWLELRPANAGVILGPEPGEKPKLGAPDLSNNGFRPIYFGVANPGDVPKTQTLRVYCKSNPTNADESPLYRDIVITVQPRQYMKVYCKPERVNRYINENVDLEVWIPDGLSESMFPLVFDIEPQKMTLTPDNTRSSMPVVSGYSMVDPEAKIPSFHFERTVTWDEYKSLVIETDFEDESRWRLFTAHFKSNCEYSGTTIYVSNEYFRGEKLEDGTYQDYAFASFSDYRSFKDPMFTTSVPRLKNRTVSISLGVQEENNGYQPVWLNLKNLTPIEPDPNAQEKRYNWDAEKGVYVYLPTADDITMDFNTETDDGDVSVTLLSPDNSYEASTLSPWHFSSVGIVEGYGYDENVNADVAYSHVSSLADKYFLLSYLTDSSNPEPHITIKDPIGVKGNVTSFDDPGEIGNSGHQYYREKWLQTQAGIRPVSFIMSAVGYVEESLSVPRYKGSVYSWTLSGEDWTSLIANNGEIQKSSGNAQLYFTIQSKTEGKEPTLDGNSIKLPQGGQYELEAEINNDVYLYFAQISYAVSGGTLMKPRDSDVVPNPDGGAYYAYMGNINEYMWNIPWGVTTGSLVMDAKQDIVITSIILRGFRGVLYDSTGNNGGGDIGLGDNLNDGGGL